MLRLPFAGSRAALVSSPNCISADGQGPHELLERPIRRLAATMSCAPRRWLRGAAREIVRRVEHCQEVAGPVRYSSISRRASFTSAFLPPLDLPISSHD